MKPVNTTLRLVVLPLLFAIIPALADSQNIIKRSEYAYLTQPKIEFSVASSAVTNAVVPSIKPVFNLLPADMNVRSSLRRWMKVAGYQDVVWDLRDDIPTDRELTFEGDLNASLLGLMQALKTGPAPARACVYTNKVVRIIPATLFL